ncbi:MAG TPA: PAS domain S-box protein [Blastocatellia bacterium]|nr:PAS domain S-box protein [Blastocatellia bacterium]
MAFEPFSCERTHLPGATHRAQASLLMWQASIAAERGLPPVPPLLDDLPHYGKPDAGRVPRLDGAEMTAPNPSGETSACEFHRLSVLLVMNDSAVRPAAIAQLIPDFDFREAAGGPAVPQALIALRPDLIMACCAQADSAAFDLCRQIKGSDGARGIPLLLAIGGCLDDEHAQEALRSGADDIVDIAGLPSLTRTRIRLLASRGEPDKARCPEAGRSDGAEQALAESHRFLSSLLDHAPAPIYVVGREGRYMLVNRSWEQRASRLREDAVGKTRGDLWPAETARAMSEIDQYIIRTGEPFVTEESINTAEGHRLYQSVKFPVFDSTGQVDAVGGISLDITGIKTTEVALRDSERRYQTLTEVSPVGIFYADPQARCVYVNDRWCEIAGLSAEEAAGTGWVRALHPDDRERVLDEWRRAAEQSRHFKSEYRVERPDGEIAWVFAQGVAETTAEGCVAGYVGTITDITELRRAQEGLSRLASIVESSDDAIMSCTTDGRITSWNSGAEKTYGYRALEAMGRSISFLIPPDRPDDTLLILENITRPESVHNYEVLHAKRDGKVIIVSLTVSPIRDPAGLVIGASLIARDVTSSHQLQEELRQAQKMDAIGRLAGGIAHDFNNLLTAINGYSDLTLMTLTRGDQAYENIAEIRKSGERAASLTRQLLAFGRKQLLQPRILDLNVIITDMNKMLRRLIGEHIELVTNTRPGLGAVKADPGQIEQIIVNLAVNARDAMQEGGILTIDTSNVIEAESGMLPPPNSEVRAWVFIEVSDTGCGMDPVTLSRVFEPFFSTKEQGKGSGLGLSTVYGIVKQSGGHISAESAVGCGSCFKIYLPMIDPAESASLAGSKKPAEPDGWETILLIEDEDTVRHLASHVLRMHGYRVLEARHAGEALKIAEGHDDAIHLMLTDVVMPKMNGRQLAERLAPLRPGMKVIYMSGYNDDIVLNAGLAPHIAFLQKPFPPDLLVEKVRRVLDDNSNRALR